MAQIVHRNHLYTNCMNSTSHKYNKIQCYKADYVFCLLSDSSNPNYILPEDILEPTNVVVPETDTPVSAVSDNTIVNPKFNQNPFVILFSLHVNSNRNVHSKTLRVINIQFEPLLKLAELVRFNNHRQYQKTVGRDDF